MATKCESYWFSSTLVVNTRTGIPNAYATISGPSDKATVIAELTEEARKRFPASEGWREPSIAVNEIGY